MAKGNGRTKSAMAAYLTLDKLPFEIQKEALQHLLISANQTLRPEEIIPKKRKRHFMSQKSLSTQLLHVNKTINAVAVQVLYGCNRFHFTSVSLFNKFTDTISPLGVQSLRYLAINYPTCRSFQVASLRRIVMGTEILDLQVLELNMCNMTKMRWLTEKGPSASAQNFVDLLEARKESESAGNNEILFAIKETFDINTAAVMEQLSRAEELMDEGNAYTIDEYCTVKLTRKID